MRALIEKIESKVSPKQVAQKLEKMITSRFKTKKISITVDRGSGYDMAFDIRVPMSSDLYSVITYTEDGKYSGYALRYKWSGDSSVTAKGGLSEKELVDEVVKLLEYEFGSQDTSESVDDNEKSYAQFHKRYPEYNILEKAIGLDDSANRTHSMGIPVSSKNKSYSHELSKSEAAMLIKKGYLEKLYNDHNGTVSYFAQVTDRGHNMYGSLRKELMGIGYEE